MAFQCCISSEQIAGMLRSSKVEASIAYNGIQTIRTYLKVELYREQKVAYLCQFRRFQRPGLCQNAAEEHDQISQL